MTDVDTINALLDSHTFLYGVTLSWREDRGGYDLLIGLGAHPLQRSVFLLCQNAGQIRLSGVGPGLSQACGLRVKDVRDRQWDRVCYEVEDLEHRSFYLVCQSIEVLPDLGRRP